MVSEMNAMDQAWRAWPFGVMIPMLLIAGLPLLAQPLPANAQASRDASCGPREGSVTAGPGGNAREAQTFTAQATGDLTTAQVDVTKGGTPADWIMHINAVDGTGIPTNAILASATIPDSTVPSGPSIITGNFASPAPVVAGQPYALVVTRPGSDSLTVGTRSGDDCPGQLFISSSQGGTFMQGGVGADLVFTVFVQPPVPDTTAALISGAVADPKKFTVDKQGDAETEVPLVAKGTTFRYTLSESAQVKFSMLRRVTRKGKNKLKPVGAFVAQGQAGQNAKPFSGVIGNKKLKPGKYIASLTSTDAAGNVSPAATVNFKVVKAQRK